jgi:hypothetical protein
MVLWLICVPGGYYCSDKDPWKYGSSLECGSYEHDFNSDALPWDYWNHISRVATLEHVTNSCAMYPDKMPCDYMG